MDLSWLNLHAQNPIMSYFGLKWKLIKVKVIRPVASMANLDMNPQIREVFFTLTETKFGARISSASLQMTSAAVISEKGELRLDPY